MQDDVDHRPHLSFNLHRDDHHHRDQDYHLDGPHHQNNFNHYQDDVDHRAHLPPPQHAKMCHRAFRSNKVRSKAM